MAEQHPDVVIAWTRGDTTVRWSSPAGIVEKQYELPPPPVMAWREYNQTLALVVASQSAASASVRRSVCVW